MNIGNHHAYVIEGERDLVLDALFDHLKEKYNIENISHPDIIQFSYENFLVEHAREIKDADIKSPFKSDKKSIVLSFDYITREAQNALLKVLEDPSPSSRFFIITRTADIFLPTILSRVEIVRHDSFGGSISQIDVEKFLKANYAKRLEMVTTFHKKISDEELSRLEVIIFLNSLRKEIEKKVLGQKGSVPMLKVVLNVIQYSEDKSASTKLLLERVCLC